MNIQTVSTCCRNSERLRWCERKTNDLKSVVERIVEEIAMHSSCIVFITDPAYRGLVDARAIEISSFLSRYDVSIAIKIFQAGVFIFTENHDLNQI